MTYLLPAPLGMRIGRIEVRFWLRSAAWAVEFWQWPHHDVVKRDDSATRTAVLMIAVLVVLFGLLLGASAALGWP